MLTQDEREMLIKRIAAFPDELEALVGPLSADELIARPLVGEWSIAQNVHHCADSHMNSYVRCKLIATEDNPTLKPYNEQQWAEFADGSATNIEVSLSLLKSLHTRWVTFWQNLPDEAWSRTGLHPKSGLVTLDEQLQLYVAHGEAHIQQIKRNLAA